MEQAPRIGPVYVLNMVRRQWAVTQRKQSELIFVVEEAPEGGYIARAPGQSIFTEADTLAELPEKVREAVRCHFEEGKTPNVVRLHRS